MNYDVIPDSFRLTVMYHDKKHNCPANDVMDAISPEGMGRAGFALFAWPFRPNQSQLHLSADTVKRLALVEGGVRLPRRWHTYRHISVVDRSVYVSLYFDQNVRRVENN